jgi:HTH-type transcriptional regulator/antitoxin HigA
MTDANPFTPDWVSPPGDTLADLLEERDWTQAELAQRTGFTRKHINDLLKGRAGITAETAERLELVFEAPASFWLEREAQYQRALAHRDQLDRLAESAPWLKMLPLAWMKAQGWVETCSNEGAQVAAALRFFAVASVDAWNDQYQRPLAAFRGSPRFERRVGAVAAWFRAAEREAQAVDARPFDAARFDAALQTIRGLTREADPAVFTPKLQAACAACGVVVVFVPAPPKCPVSGATRWLAPDKALLVLSLRHKTNDHLWFTFFHEAAHLILHGKKLVFIDGLNGLDREREAEADRFAADRLIPASVAPTLRGLRSQTEVEQVAEALGIAPGIVVGRMQHERWLPQDHLNGLKVRYAWASDGESADE